MHLGLDAYIGFWLAFIVTIQCIPILFARGDSSSLYAIGDAARERDFFFQLWKRADEKMPPRAQRRPTYPLPAPIMDYSAPTPTVSKTGTLTDAQALLWYNQQIAQRVAAYKKNLPRYEVATDYLEKVLRKNPAAVEALRGIVEDKPGEKATDRAKRVKAAQESARAKLLSDPNLATELRVIQDAKENAQILRALKSKELRHAQVMKIQMPRETTEMGATVDEIRRLQWFFEQAVKIDDRGIRDAAMELTGGWKNFVSPIGV